MDDKQLVMIHTVSPLLDVFNRLGGELLPGIGLTHILDEPLLERVRQQSPSKRERMRYWSRAQPYPRAWMTSDPKSASR